MLDAVRGYVQLATGLGEVTLRRAREVAQALLAGDVDSVVPSGGDAVGAAKAVSAQVQDLADDIVAQATSNRELLVGLIRTEIDRGAGRLGLVREEELAALRSEVRRRAAEVHGAAPPAPTKKVTAKKVAAKKPVAKKPVATKAAARKVPAENVPAPTVPAEQVPADSAAASPVVPTDTP